MERETKEKEWEGKRQHLEEGWKTELEQKYEREWEKKREVKEKELEDRQCQL